MNNKEINYSINYRTANDDVLLKRNRRTVKALILFIEFISCALLISLVVCNVKNGKEISDLESQIKALSDNRKRNY